jgi:sporulation protein YlmC with PRC-barrel domain
MNNRRESSEAATLVAASEITGSSVTNLQNEDIGKIEELLIDQNMGDVRFAVVGVGGFLGIGATRVAVPWAAIQITRDREGVRYLLDATRERLEKAPRVEGKNYERLYPTDVSEPIFVYWDAEWVAEPQSAMR